jgi:hypothetical protein
MRVLRTDRLQTRTSGPNRCRDQFNRFLQGCFELLWLRSSGLGQIRAAATPPADLGGQRGDQFAGM